jgi:hypothetical protein
MTRRTTLNLNMHLVVEASRVLETEGNTETIHAALEDVVRRARLARLAERDFSGLTPDALDELRRTDVAESPAAASEAAVA